MLKCECCTEAPGPVITSPPLPTPPSPQPATPTPEPEHPRMAPEALPKVLPDWARRRWGVKKKDTSWEDELRRQRLAEERKKKAMQMYEKLRGKRYQEDETTGLEDAPSFAECMYTPQAVIITRDIE